MGMAASQARYLALSARKSNCEYEGQQINQQRLTLSNQSANLFNQMLTISVPMPPSTTDYTTLQYSWSDGNQTFVIDEYYQLSTPDEEYNYVASYYHYEKVYTGQRKFINDPQVQATKTNHFSDLKEVQYKLNTLSYDRLKDTYTLNATNILGNDTQLILTSSDFLTNKDTVELLDYMFERVEEDEDTESYVYNEENNTISNGTTTYNYVDTETDSEGLKNLKQSYGALYDPAKHYYISGDDKYVCREDIATAQTSTDGKVQIRNLDTTTYYTDGIRYITLDDLKELKENDNFIMYTASNNPTFSDYSSVGNSKLTVLTESDYQDNIAIQTELKQIISDMGGDDGDIKAYNRLMACFDEQGNYIAGTIYTFKLSGKTYYTTTADLDESLLSAYDKNSVANNSIDSQQTKLSYYDAIYLNTKISETKKVLLETDGNGRFSTAKFEDDSVVYDLTVESITDEEGYNDAMNRYYYEKDQYDKQIANINAKTEVLQAQDRQLQLKLEQLGTEQTALQTEMEACQKVVSKNIDEGFKTFSG